MLLEFYVSNYKSIKDTQSFSMIRSSKENYLKENFVTCNISKIGDSEKCVDVLKTSAIYGANASGKSNLINAIFLIQNIIINSNKNQQGDLLPVEPFKLDETYQNIPTTFKFVFIEQSVKYMYQVKMTQQSIKEETLYYYPKGRRSKVFERINNKIKIKFNSSQIDEREKIRQQIYAEYIADNILFLSLANKLNIEAIKNAFHWFSQKLLVIPDTRRLLNTTTPMLKDHIINEEKVLEFIKIADPLISKVNIETIDQNEDTDILNKKLKDFILKISQNSNNTNNIQNISITNKLSILKEKFYRYGLDKNGNISNIEFTIQEESRGTQKFYSLIGPLLNALKRGTILICDELETSLHPLLMQAIIELFSSKENINNAQLIISTHDINLMDKRNLFRKDQIWFVEKSITGESNVYSLSDFIDTPRKELSSKNYLKGKFGAIPNVDIWELINDL